MRRLDAAGRLVVDTGIHGLGWVGYEFLAENSPTLHTITEEIDRYIASMPGQALSYMIGQPTEMQHIRASAQGQTRARFDIKRFHDAVLTSGAVPLKRFTVSSPSGWSRCERRTGSGDEYWAFILASEPTSASLRGIHDYDADLEDVSRQTEDEHIATLDELASAAEAIDPATLTRTSVAAKC